MQVLDTSRTQKIKGESVSHFFQEINQLYRPCGNSECKQDFYNIVYNGDSNINETKFFPLLIKEWFYLVKKDGFLVIHYTPNDLVDSKKIEDEFWGQWKGKYEIIKHCIVDKEPTNQKELISYIQESEALYNSIEDIGFDTNEKIQRDQQLVLILKKTCSTLVEGDNINKWTFGIITNGARNDWINLLIQSIENQNIPNYEIILCGKCDKIDTSKNIKYFPFNKRDALGWITKKKNIIVQKAQYENICILHDRYYLDDNWFTGMQKWGNNFEHITIKQIHEDTQTPSTDILHIHHPQIISLDFLRAKKTFFYSTFEHTDFSKGHYIGGGIHIGKKSIFQKVLFHENLFWKEGEDVYISTELNKLGYYGRINPYSLAITKRPNPDAKISRRNLPIFVKLFNPEKDIIHIHSYKMYLAVWLSEKSHTNILIRLLYGVLIKLYKKR